MVQPLVTIICLCYNHEDYVIKALESVVAQTYENIQLMIIDDASSDQSVAKIDNFLDHHLDIEFIRHDINIGNCRSFNEGLALAKGEYIIDLAADDILLPKRVEEGLATFAQNDTSYGINFSNGCYINSSNEITRQHYQRGAQSELPRQVPEGDVFTEVLQRHFICSPTTFIRKEVFDQLGGYDESLTYEDFDLWVRASRQWKFCYTDKILVHKRVLSTSHGQQQYKRGNSQMESTFTVCLKAYDLCETTDEYRALRRRISYEFKHALWLLKISLSIRYLSLWTKSIR